MKVQLKKTLFVKVFFVTIVCLAAVLLNSAAAKQTAIAEAVLSEEVKGSLVVYYSRSNKTRIVAKALAKAMSAEIAEIKSNKNRESGLGIFTCVLDQIMDWDDEQSPLSFNISQYDPIYIASPIWLHEMSSPARTFIKNASLTGKQVYIVLTYNGRQTDEEEKKLMEKVSSYGVSIKGLCKVITKEKKINQLEKEGADIASKLGGRWAGK